jgi:hypothetical protein
MPDERDPRARLTELGAGLRAFTHALPGTQNTGIRHPLRGDKGGLGPIGPQQRIREGHEGWRMPRLMGVVFWTQADDTICVLGAAK